MPFNPVCVLPSVESIFDVKWLLTEHPISVSGIWGAFGIDIVTSNTLILYNINILNYISISINFTTCLDCRRGFASQCRCMTNQKWTAQWPLRVGEASKSDGWVVHSQKKYIIYNTITYSICINALYDRIWYFTTSSLRLNSQLIVQQPVLLTDHEMCYCANWNCKTVTTRWEFQSFMQSVPPSHFLFKS